MSPKRNDYLDGLSLIFCQVALQYALACFWPLTERFATVSRHCLHIGEKRSCKAGTVELSLIGGPSFSGSFGIGGTVV